MTGSHRADNPVWNLYDLLRTARYNIKCLQIELSRLKALNATIDILIALTAASTVGGLWFFQSGFGAELWKWLGAVTAFLAVVKPFLKLQEHISLREELLTGYKVLENDCAGIRAEVETRRAYDVHCVKLFREALKRLGALEGKEKDYRPSRSLGKRCQAEVNNELPIERFFVPE